MQARGTGTARRRERSLWNKVVRFACVAALVAGYVPMTVQPAYAAAGFTGGADMAPALFMLNDHTVYAVHVSGSGLPTSTVLGVSVKLSDTGTSGGFNSAPGFTWNPGAGRWIQSREDASNDATIATDASGNLVAAWYYFKVGDENFTGFPAGNGHGDNQAYLTVQVQVLAGGSSYNPTVKPIVTVLDTKTQGAWVHDGVATGIAAAKRAEALKSDDASTSYSLQKTEANGIDDNYDGVIDNEDYGPAGATGDFRFGVPTGATMNVKLNSVAWATGQGVTAGPADTDIALGASDVTPPSAPSSLHATPSHNSVALDWTASTDAGSGVSGYRIYRLMAGTFGDLTLQTAVPRLIGTVGSTLTTFTDSAAVDGETDSYLVRAFDVATNVSARSNQADATLPLPDLTPPAAVADLAAVSGGTTSVNLSWTAPTDPDDASAAAYDLRYSTSPITDDDSFAAATAASGVPAPKASGTPETFSVDGLVTGTPYYFALKSRDAAGNWSALSNQASATPQAAPAGSMQIDGGSVYTTSTAVTIDSAVGGAVDMRVREAGGQWSDWSAYSASIPFSLSAGDGLKTVEAEYRNGVGMVTPLSDTITLDSTAPSGTMAISNGAAYSTTRTVSIDSTVTGATEMRKRNIGGAGNWDAWVAYAPSVTHQLSNSDGTKTVETQYRDAAGNVLDLTDTITLDTVAPTGTMAINGGAAYTTTSAVTIDSAVTGATLMRKRNTDGGGNWGSWTAYSASVTHSLQKSDGLKTAEVQYSDDAGNILDLTDTITLDSVAPTGTMAINGGVSYTSTTSVTIGSSVTGATEMRLRESGGTWSGWTAYADSAPLTFSDGDGLKTAEAEYRDAAGNVLALSDSITLDSLAPTGAMSVDAGAAYTTTTSVSVDSNVTGAADMRVRDAAGTWSDWAPYAADVTLILTPGDGLKTVEAEYRSAGGNVGSLSETIMLDTVAPAGTMSVNGGASYTTTTSVAVGSVVTGATEMRVREFAGTWSGWTPYAASATLDLASGDGFKTVQAEYRDAAGNVLALSDHITLDSTAPQAGHSIARHLFVDAPAEILLVGSDTMAYAGLAWTLDGNLSVNTAASAQTTVTVSALGSHTLTYWAVDQAGNESAHVTVPFTVQATAGLALTTHSTTLASYGAACAIAGSLQAGGAGVAGQRVVLQSSSNNRTFADTSLATTTTAGGAFAFSVKPGTKTYYRVRFATTDSYVGANSSSISVLPRLKVSTPVAPKTMYHFGWRTIYGYQWPHHTSGASAVRLYRYRYVRGAWRQYGGAVTMHMTNHSTYSKYSLSVRLPIKGKWRVRAYVPADSGHAGAWSSGYDYITVK